MKPKVVLLKLNLHHYFLKISIVLKYMLTMSKVWKKLSRILASIFSIMSKKLILLFLLPNENDKIKQIMRHIATKLG
jgi:hypothetical protein